MTKNEENSAISTFFYAKSVFLTGATGFVGKQILEKLLRSCSGIDRIYILVRSKRGVDVNERIRQICLLPLFDQVRLLIPNFESKIIPITGDLTKANLDLTTEDEQILIENCHIVINSGASVRFDAPLKEAIRTNVYSVQNMINLCKKIQHLKSFVHISTTYIHCYRTDINEIIYPMEENPVVLLESLENFNEKIFDHLSKKILQKYPNSYIYSKSLAEYLLLQQGNNLPLAIIRPSIIGAAWKEPIPGWVDSYAGPTGVMVLIGKRMMRTGLVRSIVDHPTIPVDTVANMTIAIAWFTAINNNSLSTPTVYNCCTGTHNKTCLSQEDFCRTVEREEKAIGFDNYDILEPYIKLTMNKPYYYFRCFIYELLPAYLIDILARLMFKKAKMVKLCEKVNNLKVTLHYFCQNQWIFANRNSQLLQNQMNEFDRQEFNFDLTELNWSSYLRDYCIGIKKYLLKEDLSQPSSIKRSSKYSFIKAKRFRRLASVLFFFAVTWIIRRMFLRKIWIIWKTLNFMLPTYFHRDKKKFLYALE